MTPHLIRRQKTRAYMQAGVTLIELLVVITVMASLAVGVSLSAGRSVAPGESDLARFRNAYELARSLAVHGMQRRGVLISADGSRSARWVAGDWVIAKRLQPWRNRVSYLVEGRRPGPETPNIIFLPNGQTSAFVISFAQARCSSDGWTGLRCDAG